MFPDDVVTGQCFLEILEKGSEPSDEGLYAVRRVRPRSPFGAEHGKTLVGVVLRVVGTAWWVEKEVRKAKVQCGLRELG